MDTFKFSNSSSRSHANQRHPHLRELRGHEVGRGISSSSERHGVERTQRIRPRRQDSYQIHCCGEHSVFATCETVAGQDSAGASSSSHRHQTRGSQVLSTSFRYNNFGEADFCCNGIIGHEAESIFLVISGGSSD